MLGSYLSFLFFTIVCLVVIVSGLLFTRKKIIKNHHGQFENQASAFLSVAGSLYAIVLGLIVANSLNDFQQARQNVQAEATALRNIYHMSSGLPDITQTQLKDTIIKYSDLVVNDEWKAMGNGCFSPMARQKFISIWKIIATFNPVSNAQENMQSQLLNLITEVSNARHNRLLASNRGYSPLIHCFLWLGGLITMTFTYFFYIKDLKLQIAMTVLVTLLIVFNLIMVEMFAYPFSGDVKITPEAFIFTMNSFVSE